MIIKNQNVKIVKFSKCIYVFNLQSYSTPGIKFKFKLEKNK